MTSPPSQPAPRLPEGAKPYMTCREVLDFVMAYIDGELRPGQRHEFERHLAVCPSCVNYLQTYKTTIALGKSAMAHPDAPAAGLVPEGLIRAVREARRRGL